MKPIRLMLLLALLARNHGAKRENPLDPELTPAVTLTGHGLHPRVTLS